MVTVNCTHCGTEFKTWRSKYIKAIENFKGHLYCSRKCSRTHQRPFYERFYWCDNCKWIDKHSVIVKPKGSNGVNGIYVLKRDNVMCSKCRCPLDMRRNEKMSRRAEQKLLKMEVARIE